MKSMFREFLKSTEKVVCLLENSKSDSSKSLISMPREFLKSTENVVCLVDSSKSVIQYAITKILVLKNINLFFNRQVLLTRFIDNQKNLRFSGISIGKKSEIKEEEDKILKDFLR
jgi:hypothetical protein